MKVLLINTPISDRPRYSCPPIGLLYLVSSLREAGHEADIVDGVLAGESGVLSKVKEYKPHAVGFRIVSISRHPALRMAALVKAQDPRIQVWMGGPHASTLPTHVKSYPFVDDVCIGDGEKWIVDKANGKEASVDFRLPLDRIPFPAWDRVDFDAYKVIPRGRRGNRALMTTSRGCTQSCSFCFSPNLWRVWRARSTENVIAEMQLLYDEYKIRDIMFTDDLMTVDRDRTMALCEAIIGSKMKLDWSCTTRVDAVDKELLLAMKKSGCKEIAYGVESGSPKILDLIHKEVHDIPAYLAAAKRALRDTTDIGIKCTTLTMVGNYGETDETVQETANLLKEIKPSNIAYFGGVMITPGTGLYRQAVKEGHINDEFWFSDVPAISYPYTHAQIRKWSLMLDSYQWKRWIRRKIEYTLRDNTPRLAAFLSAMRRKIAQW